MRKYLTIFFLYFSATAMATDEQYEENWRIAADGLQQELTAICERLLPVTGTPLDEVLAKYGEPKEMYLNNSFNIRTLEFNFDVRGQSHGLATVLPATMKVTFLEDQVAEAYFSMPNIDNRSSRISRQGITREPNTEQTRFNILHRAVGYMKRVEEHMETKLNLKKAREEDPTNGSSQPSSADAPEGDSP